MITWNDKEKAFDFAGRMVKIKDLTEDDQLHIKKTDQFNQRNQYADKRMKAMVSEGSLPWQQSIDNNIETVREVIK